MMPLLAAATATCEHARAQKKKRRLSSVESIQVGAEGTREQREGARVRCGAHDHGGGGERGLAVKIASGRASTRWWWRAPNCGRRSLPSKRLREPSREHNQKRARRTSTARGNAGPEAASNRCYLRSPELFGKLSASESTVSRRTWTLEPPPPSHLQTRKVIKIGVKVIGWRPVGPAYLQRTRHYLQPFADLPEARCAAACRNGGPYPICGLF